MDKKKVTVTSTVNGTTSIYLPHLNFKKEWPAKGAKNLIEADLLEEMMFDPGTEYMFKTGMLDIEDMDTKIKMGLEPEGAKEPVNVIVLSNEQMKRLLTTTPLNEFKSKMKKVSIEQVQNIVDYAIDNELAPLDKCDVLRDLSGTDILKAITLKREAKEV